MSLLAYFLADQREFLEPWREGLAVGIDRRQADFDLAGPEGVDRGELFPVLPVDRGGAEDAAAAAFDADVAVAGADALVVHGATVAALALLEERERAHLAVADDGAAFEANEVVRIVPDDNAGPGVRDALGVGRFAAGLECAGHFDGNDEVTLDGANDAWGVELVGVGVEIVPVARPLHCQGLAFGADRAVAVGVDRQAPAGKNFSGRVRFELAGSADLAGAEHERAQEASRVFGQLPVRRRDHRHGVDRFSVQILPHSNHRRPCLPLEAATDGEIAAGVPVVGADFLLADDHALILLGEHVALGVEFQFLLAFLDRRGEIDALGDVRGALAVAADAEDLEFAAADLAAEVLLERD